ncbi:MAG: VanZ family protein [Acetatifactor sp.]
MMKYVYKDMASMVKYLPWGLITGIPLGVLVAGILARVGRGKKTESSSAPIVAFCIYAAVMMSITFLSRENGSRAGIDLELFSTWGINDRNNAYVVENVLLFIPYGFLCCWAFPGVRGFFRCTMVGALTSMGIESLQLATGRGVFQIDDILTNILGTIIGYFLFRFLRWVKKGSSGGKV